MAIPVAVPGNPVLSSDANEFYVPHAAYKTVQEDVTSSTAMQNDNDLVVAVAANAAYWFSCVLFYKGGTNTSSDFKWQWTAPAGATLRYAADYLAVSTTAQIGVQLLGTDVKSACTTGVGNVFSVRMTGSLIMSSTAGSLQLQWAQNTSNATATTVGPGSVLALQRIF